MTVTPETVATALGRTAPDDPSPERDQWEMWIGDALMLISARLGAQFEPEKSTAKKSSSSKSSK